MNFNKVLCAMCGNERSALAGECPFCGEKDSYNTAKSGWSSFVINLENNLPTVDAALDRFHEQLESLKGRGIRLIKVIHGHGSSGTGGKIRRAFRQAMDDGLWGEAITEVYYGEILTPNRVEYSELISRLPSIKTQITKDMQGNPGITLLILNKNY
jgi:hypothetical protein